MVTTVGPDSTAIPSESGLETPSGSWSLHKHAVTPAKPSGCIALWTTPNSLVGEGGSDWVVNTLGSSVQGIWTSPSPKLQLQGLFLGPFDKGGICPAVTMGLEGCNTFSQPGNLFRGLFSAVGSMVASTAASFTGVLAGVGWAPLGVTSSGGMMGLPLEEPQPWTHPHQRKRGSTSSPPRVLLCSLPKGMVYLQ